MMGLDILGPLLVVLALALMTVSPLHLTIARAKEKVAWFAAAIDDGFGDAQPAADREKAIEAADADLADDPLIRSTAAIADIFNHV